MKDADECPEYRTNTENPDVPDWFQYAFQNAFRDHETYGEGVDEMWTAVLTHGQPVYRISLSPPHPRVRGLFISLDDDAA